MRLGKDVLAADLYGLLGVSPGARAEQIRRAYRREIRRSHPDLRGREDPAAERRTIQLNLAASVLLDPALRRAYDQARAARPGPAGGPLQVAWRPPAPAPPDVPLGPELERVLGQLRTPAETALWHVLLWTRRQGPSGALAFTAACVAFFCSVMAAARPQPLFDPPERPAARVEMPSAAPS